MRARDGFKDPQRLGWWVIATSAATITASLVFTFGTWLHPLPNADEPWHAVDVLTSLSALGYLAGLVSAVVLGLAWTFRVAWNAWHIGARGFDVSPAMSVGWYFVPLANLYKPYQAIRQVYLASRDPAGWEDVPAPVVATWWGLVIAAGVFGRLSRAMGDTETINWLDLVTTTLASGAALAFILMVKHTTAAQCAAAASLRGQGPAA